MEHFKNHSVIIDADTHREDTGIIKVYNYPPAKSTHSYITKVYREIKKGVFGWKEVEGNPIYFDSLPPEQHALAVIIGEAQNALLKVLA